jgi:hypothetical protein
MFFPGSRYAALVTYQITLQDGTTVAVTRLPTPVQNPLLGYFPRQNSQRIDQVASYFLSDATAFWRLCDANDTPVPDALAARSLIGIPGTSV